jgi:hypothetical protein
MEEKELKRFYKKYIDRNLYRVVSEEYLSNIKKKGIEPDKDPYHDQIPLIKKLFALILKLEKKGFIHQQDWGFKVVTAEYIVKVSNKDIDNPYVDFTPRYKETFFYKKHRGGALVKTIKEITEDILARKPSLTKKEMELVNDLHKWALFKSSFKNKTLFFKGSSKYFETAHFQMIHSGKDYLESPFGRYEHFKKIIKKNGLAIYEPYLKGEKSFYLRAVLKIPATEIIKIV